MSNQFLTAQQVADYLEVNIKTVYVNARKIPGYIKIAGCVRFNRDTFLKWTVGLEPTKERVGSGSDDRHQLL
jgi:hypothetical protein